ncbi:hypothetical protein HD806DRAFT_497265 [Xylariaceae sp. AK1471]|nr:hypothetical protein HD806DRAFT_497265 [Xylariaceae sp. AK1471]
MTEQLSGDGNGNVNGPVFDPPGPSQSSLSTIQEMSSEATARPSSPTSNESKGTGHHNGNGSLEVAQPQSTQPEDPSYPPVPRVRSRSLPPFFLRADARPQASPIARPGHIMIYTSGGYIEMPAPPPESSSTSRSQDDTNGDRSTAAEQASPITGGPVRRPTPENLRAVGGFFSSNDIAFAEAAAASNALGINNTLAPPPPFSGHGQRGDNAPGGEVHMQSHSALEPSSPRGQIEDEAPRQRWSDRIRQRFRRSRNQDENRDENRDANQGENRSNFRRIARRIFGRDSRNRP